VISAKPDVVPDVAEEEDYDQEYDGYYDEEDNSKSLGKSVKSQRRSRGNSLSRSSKFHVVEIQDRIDDTIEKIDDTSAAYLAFSFQKLV
jgi:hypothetical protein